MTARFLVADVFDGLTTLEDGSVDLVVTSPPFLALRSYLPADHPDKGKEIGSEATPAAFLDVMLRFTAELRRVVAPHGSICVELGDTYAGSGGGGGDYLENGLREGQQQFAGSAAASMRESNAAHWRQKNRAKNDWPLAKSKTLIPELFRIALAYGINPLTGEPSPAGQWRVRNVVTWARPNPPVGALGDKWRPATSDVVVACTSAKRYWDDLATRRAFAPATLDRTKPGSATHNINSSDGSKDNTTEMGVRVEAKMTHSGAPLLYYWEIPLDPDEEPTRYGPTPPKDRTDRKKGEQDRSMPELLNNGGHMGTSDAGAPLLDYWEIPLDPDEEPTRYGPKPPTPRNERPVQVTTNHGGNQESRNDYGKEFYNAGNASGAPLLDYWVIPPGGYIGSHYAVFPPELVVPLIKAMCPEKVCRTCGEPSRRIVETQSFADGEPSDGTYVGRRDRTNGIREGEKIRATFSVQIDTLGWTDCGHDNWRPGVVLDPFAGSGTTLLVATGHGHDAIGIDLDARNAELALQRVGPFLLEVV